MQGFKPILLRLALQATLAIPDETIRWLIGRKAETYRGQTLHPKVQLGLRVIEQIGAPSLNSFDPRDARGRSNTYFDMLDIPKIRLPVIEDKTLPGPAGPIPVRIYKPKAHRDNMPSLIYFHGGGFVLGDIDGYDHPCRKLAKVAGCAVISVAYRLAPEHRFPAAFEDSWAVFDWIRNHGAEWGLDTQRIALCGDSAGGTIAAATAQKARDVGGVQPNLQVLIYPRVDSVNISPSGMDLKNRGLMLTEELMQWYKGHVISHPDDVHDVRISPLLHGNFADLAPAIVVTCGFDPLWDEAAAYADKLEDAGVEVERIHLPDMIHAVWSAGGVLKGVRKLQKHIGKQVRAAHKGRLEMSEELLAIAS